MTQRILVLVVMALCSNSANACDIEEWSWQHRGSNSEYIDFNAVTSCASGELFIRFYEGTKFLVAKKVVIKSHIVDEVIEIDKVISRSADIRIRYKKLK